MIDPDYIKGYHEGLYPVEWLGYKFKQKEVNSFKDWIYFVIRVYSPLALRFQEIKKHYYEGINNIY